MHACGVLHRDINPKNVIIRRTGTLQAHLIDFNRALPSEQFFDGFLPEFRPTPADRFTMRGDVILEDPRYSAPEVRTHRRFTAASDIYALGVLLHHLATGMPPGITESIFIEGGVEADILNMTLKRMLDPLASRRPGLEEIHDEFTAATGRLSKSWLRRHVGDPSVYQD